MELNQKIFKLSPFLRSITDIIHIRVKQKKSLELICELEPTLPAAVKGDETRLRQILINLLGNAVKFTRQGQVILRVNTQAEDIRFQIEDTGPGIAKAELENIFLPFRQVNTQAYVTEGTGLGLAISRKFVEMMGSTLQVKSYLGQGSIFWFDLHLPVITALPAARPAPKRDIIGFEGQSRKVLVVDDKLENRIVLSNFLAPLGFKVYEACNGEEGIAQALAHYPDVILMDLVMPVMNGLEATHQLRQSVALKDTIIIAISASAFEQSRQDSLAAGCHDFIVKPIQADELLEKLRLHTQLTWQYGETKQEDTSLTQAWQDQPLVAPPAEIVEVLYDLAMRGDVIGILRQANQLKQQDPQFISLAAKLQQMAETFQTRQLREFIKRYLSPRQH